MKKPVVLITGGPAFDKRHRLASRMLNKTYPNAIQSAGGIPFMDLDYNAQDEYLEIADGAIFTGTHAFAPDGTFDLEVFQHERRIKERELMLKFIKAGKPVFAICQGMQQLNIALGGDLHINFKLDYGVEHYATYHTIKAEKGSLINEFFGDELTVNSYHNVKVGKLAPSLKATAFSPDGVIEAYEHESLPVYGFQWHPERMRGDFHDTPGAPDTTELFKFFIGICSK